MAQRFIMIASSKGGIGKSTAALGISLALCKKGLRVLLVDLDLGNACLDLMTGSEDMLYTLKDVAFKKCSAEDALVRPAGDNMDLFLLGASGDPDASLLAADEKTVENFAGAILYAADTAKADYVILDTGAGISTGAAIACRVAEKALVVASHSPVSVRSAEATAMRLSECGVGEIQLIINSFDPVGVRRKNGRSGIFSIVDSSRLPLCGIIPYDYSMTVFQEKCLPGPLESSLASIAFGNIADRLTGESVPLFDGMRNIRKNRHKFYK